MQIIGVVMEIILTAAMMILAAGGFLIAQGERISRKSDSQENPLAYGCDETGKKHVNKIKECNKNNDSRK
ncbi:hypothetical protein [Treponema sp. UBA753]|uniref:hypothetical protein n=1 Tax=Treponema sp. UBA753 TaxID=1947747 RepID=UPI0025E2D9E3|nr:hypothetical protein [Treponema sp. UBA753]